MLRKALDARTTAFLLGATLLFSPALTTAQRHGGAGGDVGGGGLSSRGRPTGISDKDDLKDFHEALAVEASSQQAAQFEALMKSTAAAQSELKALLQGGKEYNAADLTRHDAALDQALGKARDDNKNFLGGFSSKQKDGLKKITKRLLKADSELAQQEGKLDRVVQSSVPAAPEVSAIADNLGKALASFSDEQLALGREMNIAAANPQQLVFALPPSKSPLTIGNQHVVVTVSGALSQIAAENGQRTFKLDLRADLADLQQNVTEILRARLNRSESCGQQIDIRQATLVPSAPASLLSVQLHFERWVCTHMSGQMIPNELAEGEAAVEIKLTPAVESGSLKLVAEFARIDATGMVGEALRSGSLGEELREKATDSVLSAMQAGADFKLTLPPAAQSGAALQSAKFEHTATGVLRVDLLGQVQLSDEQTKVVASQLKETLSAQGTPLQ